MATRPSWQGHLKLSLVTCPVALYNAISPAGEVHFNLINPKTGNRVRMQTVDAGTEETLERKDLVRGFEISKGDYVVVTAEEIEGVRLESTKTIDIDEFVPAASIDRLYWDHPYYLAPDGKLASEPFAVIRTAMEKEGNVALGRVVMSQRERIIALEPRGQGIIATTLRSHDEVRSMKDAFADISASKPDKEMISIAQKIMAQKAAEFDPEKFEDRYETALRDLIEEKRKGHALVHPEERETANVIDLMSALEQSLRGARRPAAKSQSARAASAARHPARKVAPSKKPGRSR